MEFRNYLADSEDEQLANMMSRGYGDYSPPPVNAMTNIGMGLARTAAPMIFRAEEIAEAPLQQRRAMAAGEGMGLGGHLAFTGMPQAAKSIAKKITVRDYWGNKVSVNLKQIGNEYEIPYNDFLKILNDTHGLSLKGQIGKGEEFDFGKLPWQGGSVKVPAEYVTPGPPKAALESFEAAKKVPTKMDVYSTKGKLTGGGLPYIAEITDRYGEKIKDLEAFTLYIAKKYYPFLYYNKELKKDLAQVAGIVNSLGKPELAHKELYQFAKDYGFRKKTEKLEGAVGKREGGTKKLIPSDYKAKWVNEVPEDIDVSHLSGFHYNPESIAIAKQEYENFLKAKKAESAYYRWRPLPEDVWPKSEELFHPGPPSIGLAEEKVRYEK